MRQRPFEAGNLEAKHFETRVSTTHEARLDELREQDADLARQLAPRAATAPDAAELAAVADNLDTTIATAEPRQAKVLLRLLIRADSAALASRGWVRAGRALGYGVNLSRRFSAVA